MTLIVCAPRPDRAVGLQREVVVLSGGNFGPVGVRADAAKERTESGDPVRLSQTQHREPEIFRSPRPEGAIGRDHETVREAEAELRNVVPCRQS